MSDRFLTFTSAWKIYFELYLTFEPDKIIKLFYVALISHQKCVCVSYSSKANNIRQLSSLRRFVKHTKLLIMAILASESLLHKNKKTKFQQQQYWTRDLSHLDLMLPSLSYWGMCYLDVFKLSVVLAPTWILDLNHSVRSNWVFHKISAIGNIGNIDITGFTTWKKR